MRLAVLSGKGGAGKTFVSVNLAAAAEKAVYVDCDVEEPNGRLFLKPERCTGEEVCTWIPAFDEKLCTGCRKCVDFCRFNALVYVGKKPMIFPEVCHSCGGCSLVCPAGAVHEDPHPIGRVETGYSGSIRVITGELNTGETSGVPVIKAALRASRTGDDTVIVDCPPGSACPVMESVSDADFCILVAEPTAFGFHNFKMVHELVSLLHKPCGVVINKADAPYEPLETFCGEHSLPVLLRVPYSPALARLGAAGEIASRRDPELGEAFRGLLNTLKEEVRP